MSSDCDRSPWQTLPEDQGDDSSQLENEQYRNTENPPGQPALPIDAPAMTNQTANRGGASNRMVENIDDRTGNTEFPQTPRAMLWRKEE